MKLADATLNQTLQFYNGKATDTHESGIFTIYGSNGTIGFSNEFNHEAAIVLGRVGAYCGSAKISDDKFWASDNTIVVKPKPGHSLHYWYYLLKTLSLRSYAGGAAQPLLTHGILSNVKTKYHSDFHQQVAIASILSAYDDLIENNNRRIRLLEESARLLYQEWFVRLRFPGYEHTRIVDGVPEGWEKGVVSDYYYTASGGTPSRKNPDYFIGNIPWVKTQELQNGFVIETEEKITEEALKDSAAKIFPAKTILVAMYGATIGQIGILSEPSSTNQACCALIPNHENTSYIFIYFFFRENKANLKGLSQGAAQNNINQQIIKNYEIVVPTSGLIRDFCEVVEPTFDMILNLQLQNQKLKAARDLLLPKLMSGEIAV